MKKVTFAYIFPALLGILILTSSCGNSEEGQAQAAAQQQTPTLPVIEIPARTVTGYNSYPTSIEGIVNSNVRAKIQGYIQEVLVDEGEKVKKGQPLFKLETQSLSQDANAAQANVNAAQVEVDKLQPLVEKDIISNVQLETAKAQLQQAKSSYSSIAANIDYATVKSPVDGYVGAIPYRQGNLVGPTDQMPLTVVTVINKVYAYFSMNESDYLTFLQDTEGETRQKKVDNFPEISLVLTNGTVFDQKGKIQTVTGQVNQNTGTVSFRAIFDNPEQLITNGNSGTIQIPVTYEDVAVIPQPSTYEQQGHILVYKVMDSNKVQSTTIKTKATVGNLYIVESGVKKGDMIVAKGAGSLQPNATIKPKKIKFDSVAKPVEQLFQ